MPTVGAEQTVLIWQHLIGIELRWVVVAMAVTTERTHWFYSLNALDRRAYSEEINQHLRRTDGRPLGNSAKIFFNNEGVVAKGTDVCTNYARGDMSVWDWPTAR